MHVHSLVKILLRHILVASLCTASCICALLADPLYALPYGFGYNQAHRTFYEVQNKDFIIYFDKKVGGEGILALQSMSAAKPILERWFDIHRPEQLPVVMSADSMNASFANFITDSIELQTLGQMDPSLAWHELTHTITYEQFHNIFGHFGSLIHLVFIPAWYLEGLAETLSMSIGSDATASIERYQALTNDWPSYDRLHSLYGHADFAERGYATSGGFVTYFMANFVKDDLPRLQQDLYWRSMPWYWPAGLIPFAPRMPFDSVFKSFTNQAPSDFYKRYQEQSKMHWQKHRQGPFFIGEHFPKQNKLTFAYSQQILPRDNKLFTLTAQEHGSEEGLVESEIKFDVKTGWATDTTATLSQPKESLANQRIKVGSLWIEASHSRNLQGIYSSVLKVTDETTGNENTLDLKDSNSVQALTHTNSKVYFVQYQKDRGKLCYVQVEHLKTFVNKSTAKLALRCPFKVKQPLRLHYLNTSASQKSMWLAVEKQSTTGPTFDIYKMNLEKLTQRKFLTTFNRPYSLVELEDSIFILQAEKSRRSIFMYSAEGQCQKRFLADDFIRHLYTADGKLALLLYAGGNHHLLSVKPDQLTPQSCQSKNTPTSPLLYALQQPRSSLAQALNQANYWNEQGDERGIKQGDGQRSENTRLTKGDHSVSLEQDAFTDTASDAEKKPAKAKWRAQPLFLFPWIGADDAMGPAFGIVSLPLMDHLQNESVYLSLLYGWPSRFPHQEISLFSTRFWPSLKLSLYRQQRYNGSVINLATEKIETSYLEEKGMTLSVDSTFYLQSASVSVGSGIKHAQNRPYIGPSHVRSGTLTEFVASAGLNVPFYRFSLNVRWNGATAPYFANDDFDYAKLGAGVSLGMTVPEILNTHWLIGIEGSRTRGSKTFALREIYTPLRTFIPGSGGGLQQNSFPLTVPDGLGLFDATYGNTQARAKASMTMPIISDLDSFVWLFYFYRLDFSAFYNYGGAWNGDEPSYGWDHLIRAHGYTFDLQFENKGINFNAGVGVGQVVSYDYQAYISFGFDLPF